MAYSDTVDSGGSDPLTTVIAGLLALAGVAAGDAVLATFAYRLFSYWLPQPLGLAAFALHRSAPARA
jgi:uncharacterized membrane protein YbhN (UPF0104 family)